MGESIPETKQILNKRLTFKTDAKTLKELKVACVMDRFTLDSYKYECKLFEVTPDNWKDLILTYYLLNQHGKEKINFGTER